MLSRNVAQTSSHPSETPSLSPSQVFHNLLHGFPSLWLLSLYQISYSPFSHLAYILGTRIYKVLDLFLLYHSLNSSIDIIPYFISWRYFVKSLIFIIISFKANTSSLLYLIYLSQSISFPVFKYWVYAIPTFSPSKSGSSQ